jgi:ABC-type transporter Mla subunit MlaD
MPNPSERSRNNFRAGVFVSVALIIALLVVAALTDAVERLRHSTRAYTVTFDVESGVSNLREGSEVRVGGVRMGQVTAITPILEEEVFRRIAVRFTLDRRIKVYADATVLVSAPLIGSEAWLEIPNVGKQASGPPLNDQLEGVSSIGVLTSLVGSQNAVKATMLFENLRQFSEFLATTQQHYDQQIAPTLEDLRATAGDVRTVVSDLRTNRWPQWAQRVDEVMTWANGATAKLDAALTDGQGLVADTRAIVNENREPIKATIANAQSATNRINSETIDKINAFLDGGQQGLDQAIAVLENLRVDYAIWSTDIGEALANANLTAQQLKLAGIEVRRSPWKLLYRPSPRELEHELLYESARSFALAAANLKAASQSVQRVLDKHPDQVAGDEEAFGRLKRNLLDSLAKYERAQQQLLDVLVADQNK